MVISVGEIKINNKGSVGSLGGVLEAFIKFMEIQHMCLQNRGICGLFGLHMYLPGQVKIIVSVLHNNLSYRGY